MVWIDYAIVAIISFSCLMSFIHGIMYEILLIVTWISAFFVASYYYVYFSVLLININNQLTRDLISISVLFFMTVIIGTIISGMIIQLVKKIGLSKIDKFFGIFFGFFRGILIVSIFICLFSFFTELSKSKDWQQSQLIPQFIFMIRWICNYLKYFSSIFPTV